MSKLNEFLGNWNGVGRDGGWDGPTTEQEEVACESGEWTFLDHEDELPHTYYYEILNEDLAKHGLIMVYFWVGGDPGMGGWQQLFKLPADRT